MPTTLADDDEWVAAPDGPATAEPRTSALIRSYLGKVNKRARWLFNRTVDLLGSWQIIESVNATTDRITITGHSIPSNTVLRVYSIGGTVPGGLSGETAYYAIVIDANTLQLSASSGPGAAVNITDAGTGTLLLFRVPDVTSKLMTTAIPVGGTSIPAGTLKSIFAQCFTALGGTFTGPVTLGSGAGRLLYDPAHTVTRVQTSPLINATTGVVSGTAVSIGAGEDGIQRLDRLPDGATLTQINVYHNRTNAGTLPTTRIKARLVKINISSGASTTIVAATEDTVSTLAAYEAYHGYAITGISEVIDNATYFYYVLFDGEAGANTTSTLWYPITCTLDVEEQDEAP